MKIKFKNPLQIGVKNLKKAVSTDELRPAMCGVYIDIKRSRLVATTAHVLMVYGITITELENPNNVDGVIVPLNFFDTNKYMVQLGKSLHVKTMMLDNLEYVLGERYAEVYLGEDLAYRQKYIDEKYPDYNSVLPNFEEVSPIEKIGIKPKLLVDVCSMLPTAAKFERVSIFSFFGKHKAIIITPKLEDAFECFALVMPMRIED